MRRALVTAFEPFAAERVNASLEAVRLLPRRTATLEIVTAELPTSFARSWCALENAIARINPDLVLCIGQAAERNMLCVERIAINVQDARIPDNDGVLPRDITIVSGGPAAYFATLPVRSAVTELISAGLPAELSNSAGTFVCNRTFYGLMHFAATHRPVLRGGLLHVPRLLGTNSKYGDTDKPAVGMALDDIVRGIMIVLETMALK